MSKILQFETDPNLIARTKSKLTGHDLVQCGGLGFDECLQQNGLEASDVKGVIVGRLDDWFSVLEEARILGMRVPTVVIAKNAYMRMAAEECILNNSVDYVFGLNDI